MFVISIAAVSTFLGTVQAVIPENIEITNGSSVLGFIPLIDGHNQLIYSIYKKNKNNLKNFDLKKNLANDVVWGTSSCDYCGTDLARLKVGRIGAQIWATRVDCSSQFKDSVQLTLTQIDVIKRLLQKNSDELELVTVADDIERVWARGKIASMISIAGGHSLDSNLAILRMYYELGVRSISLTDVCATPWADSSSDVANIKLTNFGKKIVWEMNRLGILIDLTGTTKDVMQSVLDVTRSPVIFSHSTATGICLNAELSINDDILQQLKFNNGIIMINFQRVNCNTTRKAVLEDVVGHINYIKNKIGVDHIGIGAAYETGNSAPEGLEDVSKYTSLFDRLYIGNDSGSTWTREDLEKLAGRNFIRVLKTVENIRDCMKWQTPDEDVIDISEVNKAEKRRSLKDNACRTTN